MAVADAVPLPQSQDVMIHTMQTIRILFITLLISGCAIQNPGMNNVEGNWEYYGHIYQRIEIDEDGQGYIVAGLENDIVLCSIQRIDFIEKQIILEIKCDDSAISLSRMSGYVTSTSIVIENIIEKG